MMGGSFELSASVESEKYKQVAQSDGGPSDYMIEKGTDKNLLPPTANLRFLPISDAIAYWDAELGITYAGSNLVSEWKDQGGVYTMTQATSSLQPQVKISPNKPITVVSDVSSDETVGISPAINVSEYTYFVVGRPEYNSDCLAMTTVAANTQYAFRFSYNGSGSSPRLRSGDIDIYTVDDLNMAVYSAKRTSGGTTTAFRNSIQKYSGTAPTVFDPNAIAFRYGELAVFIVYDRALTDTEMDTMETYLNGKYNIY